MKLFVAVAAFLGIVAASLASAATISPVAPATCISPTYPCVTVPVNIARTDAVGVRGFSVTVQLSANLALCTGSTATDVTEGDYLSSFAPGQTQYFVTSNGGGSYTIDCSILGATAGQSAASGNLFNLSLKNSGADGTGTVTVTSTTLRDPNNATVLSDAGAPASITIDNTLPSAISGLAATQLRTGNGLGSTTQINLSWPATEAGSTVEIWRKGFGNYPEYDDAPDAGSVPPAPGSYPPAGWSLVSGVSGTTTTSDFSETESIDFEAPAYTTGSPNGQQGWSRTGPYDHNIDGSFGQATFGAQSLRISNAITSGSFGDMTFARPLANSVGETGATAGAFSVGSRRGQFEVQFDVASTQAAQQPGMLFSMSPDRGDGSRMSYLRFEDGASGIDVFFDDVQGTTDPANFVETQVATGLARTTPHRIRLTLSALEGPSNDIVNVYIDGALVHTGTSWENYYRYDSEASGEQSTRIVKTVILRTGGDPVPANLNKGFLVDNMTLSSSTDFGSRDFWYYVAYVRDACGSRGSVSNRTNGTLNYFLGDVAAGCVGNNLVNTQDISFLGNNYGISISDPSAVGCLDVGPTTDFSVNARPTTDNKINFEDLIMFAIDYGTVSLAASSRADAPPAGSDELTVDAPRQVVAGQTILATLNLKGSGSLQGLTAQLGWDSNIVEPGTVSAGDLLASQHGVALSAKPGNVDAAMLGVRDIGLAGEGTVATVEFVAKASGDPRITIAQSEGRTSANKSVQLSGSRASVVPTRTEFAGGAPNPFKETSLLTFSLARRGPAQLAIFSVDGRRLRTLANGVREAGTFRIAWDGRDDRGNTAKPGVFFARLTTDDGHFTRTLLRVQ